MMEKNLKLEKIISIEKVGKKHCFDLNTNKGCFFANDFLIHNSADVVMLLHYPYHYDNNKDKNEILLNVAKNRDGRTGRIKMKIEPEFSRITSFTEAEKQIKACESRTKERKKHEPRREDTEASWE
jgi:hypothetical protein